MRILQVNATYGLGSTGVIVQDVGEAVRSAGGEAFFACQKFSEVLEHGYQIGNILDWKRHALLSRLLGRWGFHSAQATRAFLRYISELQPDVVHLHNLHNNYIHLELLLRFLADKQIPTVITMHDCWYFTGKCCHYVDCGCDKFTRGCGDCVKKADSPRSLFFDTSARDFEAKKRGLLRIPRLVMVGCSKWICDEAKKGFLQHCRIEQIYNGVDTRIFRPMEAADLRKRYGIEQDDYVVLGMANKWLNKGDTELIPALLQEQPDIKLMIVGCSEAQMEELRTYGPRVIGVGYIRERDELARHYNLAHVFVNATHADTLPTVNMESICCATPVITYDSGGSPELIDDETGLVVADGDHDAVVRAVSAVRHKSWEQCASVGARRFDKEACYGRYVELYQSMMASA